MVDTKERNADVIVINTCTVTHLADKKARQQVRKFRRQHPESIIAVIGCYPQTNPEAVQKMDEVDIIQGTADRKQLIELVEEAFSNNKKT